MTNKKYLEPLNLPKTSTNFYINILGVSCFLLSIALMSRFKPDINEVLATFIAMVSCALPILIYDLFFEKSFKNKTSGLQKAKAINYKRVGVKLLGLYATFAVIAGFYWLLPEYGSWYAKYYILLKYTMPFVIILSVYYFMEVDRRARRVRDAYWHLGTFILSFRDKKQRKLVNKNILTEHARRWLIKAFFFPLMFMFLSNNIGIMINYNYSSILDGFKNFYDFAYIFIYSIDVILAAIGYIMTFKILDSHIRSAEPTMLGWVVCLICYPPFWTGLFYGSYFKYDDDFFWGNWLSNSPMIYSIWGSAIIILILIYMLATVAMGYRFSNLTYRGIITSGPYKYTKHPAYICKNLSFWLISVPFISEQGVEQAVKSSLLILGVNFIYYMRAKTEENHLSNYPEYVEYANWINEHGKLRFINKLLPFVKYSENKARKSPSTVLSLR